MYRIFHVFHVSGGYYSNDVSKIPNSQTIKKKVKL